MASVRAHCNHVGAGVSGWWRRGCGPSGQAGPAGCLRRGKGPSHSGWGLRAGASSGASEPGRPRRGSQAWGTVGGSCRRAPQGVVPGPTRGDAQSTDRRTVRLRFKEGTLGDVALSCLSDAGPVFELLHAPACPRRIRVDRAVGTIVWPTGLDGALETRCALARASGPRGPA